MAIGDLTEARLDGDRFAESILGHPAELWTPSLAPSGAPVSGDDLLRQDALGPVTREEDAFESYEQADLPALRTSFASGRKLIAGTALVAALGVGAFVFGYFLSGPSGEQAGSTQTTEAPPTAVQSALETPAQAAPTTPKISPEPSAAAGSDVAPSVNVAASPQAGPEAAAGPSTTPQTVPPWESQDIVFLQRSGVNIRSTPVANGPVVGTAPKGTRFTATRREGDWTQVENGRLKGWINSQFLAAEPSAAAAPDVPPAVTAEASPQAGLGVTAGQTAMPQTVPPQQNQDIVFLQRPGVNIRSTPAANGAVVGTAPKGTRFTATRREGDWTQVENARLKGWINSQFLAAEPSAAAAPNVPPAVTADASPQAGLGVTAGQTAMPQTVPPQQNQDIVFLQRPGVNIRSTPAATGAAVGTAPKGARFTATRREGDWIQVENGRLKGWINSQFLAANKPQ